ncbi:BON domain-containing protein [Methylomonas sp. AM2-LC]|uniref:BON domain-containing protein n=1 Tax=Methylomonas sp. AM2-LC TaxID=3153301 RepID=UPI0032658D4E
MKNDMQIQKDVIAELNWEPSINPTNIGVEVKDGIVTLSGHVNSYGEKLNAEQSAQRVAGVKALAVEIDVTLPGVSNRTDADIARTVENVLQWTTYLPKNSVRVMVENGWITLSGQVDWGYQRVTAANAVLYLMGVRGVSNDITIKPAITSSSIKADIETALKRRAIADAQNISVEVHGEDVTLTGKVHSWNERDLATHSAWCTPGVKNVKDKMSFIN